MLPSIRPRANPILQSAWRMSLTMDVGQIEIERLTLLHSQARSIRVAA